MSRAARPSSDIVHGRVNGQFDRRLHQISLCQRSVIGWELSCYAEHVQIIAGIVLHV